MEEKKNSKSICKKIVYGVCYAILAVLALVGIAMIAIQIPSVQTAIVQWLAQKVLPKSTEAEITFDKITFQPFNTLVIKNLVIIDKNPCIVDTTSCPPRAVPKFRHIGTTPVDTLFKAKNISLNFTLKGMLGKSLDMTRVSVSGAEFNLVLEDGQLNTNLTRMFRLGLKKREVREDKEIFHFHEVEVHNLTFRMKSYNTCQVNIFPETIDWNDIEVTDFSLKGRHLRMMGRIMTGEVDHASFKEKSGYICNHLSGNARVGRGLSRIDNIHLVDPWSDLHVSEYRMLYTGNKDFSEYIDMVRMEGEIAPSRLNFTTLGFFAQVFKGRTLEVEITGGTAEGTVRDFQVHDITFNTLDKGVSGKVSGKVHGMPQVDKMLLDLKLREIRMTSPGFDRAARKWYLKPINVDFTKFAKRMTARLDGELKGSINALSMNVRARTPHGGVSGKLRLTNTLVDEPIVLEGSVSTNNLDMNRMAEMLPIGPVSLDGSFNLEFADRTTFRIDSVKVSRLNFMDYDYTGISGNGTFANTGFKGRVIAHEPNLHLVFDGEVGLDINKSNSKYKFDLNAPFVNLHALNLDKRGRSEVSLHTDVDFMRNSQGVLEGEIKVKSLELTNDEKHYNIGDITVTAKKNSKTYGILIDSKFAKGSYQGSGSPGTFWHDFKALTVQKELPAMFRQDGHVPEKPFYNIDFELKNTQDVFAFLAPGIYVAENTKGSLNIRQNGLMEASLTSQRIAYEDHNIKDVDVKISNRTDEPSDERISGSATIGEITVSGLKTHDNQLDIIVNDDNVGVEFTYKNKETENEGTIAATAEMSRDKEGRTVYDFSLRPSSVTLNSTTWTIHPASATLCAKTLKITDEVNIESGNQSIIAKGGYSATERDTLEVDLERFKIGIINPLIGDRFNLQGLISGNAMIISPNDDKGLILDVNCDSTSMGGTRLGDIHVSSKWNADLDRFDINLSNDIDGNTTISAEGSYRTKTRWLDAKAHLNRLDGGFAQPLLSSVFSELRGYVSGDFSAEGEITNLKIDCDTTTTRLDEGWLKIAYTNVGYNAEGRFSIDEYGTYFHNIDAWDRFGSHGKVNGKMGYDHFYDLYFDIDITTDGTDAIEALNLEEQDNEYFYGHLFGAGDISLTGPLNSVKMSATATASKEGNLHIPVHSSSNANTTGLLKFKEREIEVIKDPYLEMMEEKKRKKSKEGNFGVNLNIAATPEVEAFIEFDRSLGDVMSGKGYGNIKLDVDATTFNLTGDYTITTGNYHFVALGIVQRDFTIDGGTVQFGGGDILDSELNINASYRTKASVASLISDTTSTGSARRNVICGIEISDKMRNPRLNFTIDIPDLDPSIKARVDNALSTEDKVQKQFIYLLVTNSFLPDEQSGIVNGTTALYSNLGDLMANQFNNILQKLNIPLDLGLNYQQNLRGDNIFDVAVSTQLFNNRVIINGNLGNRQTRQTGTGFAGDVDVEIKLDRAGAFRLNLFSHSADQYTNYLDNSQRSGLGLTWQQEFDRFGQFVRRLFMKKEKKEEAAMEELRRSQTEAKEVISITAEDYEKPQRERGKRKKK